MINASPCIFCQNAALTILAEPKPLDLLFSNFYVGKRNNARLCSAQLRLAKKRQLLLSFSKAFIDVKLSVVRIACAIKAFTATIHHVNSQIFKNIKVAFV